MPVDIEKFDRAYHERSIDLSQIKQMRRIAAMHLGGVIIECLIKSIIVKYYGINQRNRITEWIATRNIPRSGRNIIQNPSHRLFQGIQLITPLFNRVDTNIIAFLNVLQRPNGIEYIDLRYHSGNITNQQYEDWLKAYTAIRAWLIKNLKTM
ncbi:hypothetical protein [Paenibacillus ginsengarvi]|uniref:hypothetical protein n=1 Tax=Paenibacillus ginsengarvi TaxID=400777 RepID=UPI000EA9FC5B|nr:hypothetical protein [Paenibacillus ginsengarvi]